MITILYAKNVIVNTIFYIKKSNTEEEKPKSIFKSKENIEAPPKVAKAPAIKKQASKTALSCVPK